MTPFTSAGVWSSPILLVFCSHILSQMHCQTNIFLYIKASIKSSFTHNNGASVNPISCNLNVLFLVIVRKNLSARMNAAASVNKFPT